MRWSWSSFGIQLGNERKNETDQMASFDEHLNLVKRKIHVVNVSDDFERKRNGLLYYWNCAERLFESAKIIWDAHGSSDIAAMLSGMSMEVLLKGIHVAFDKKFKKSHRLHELCTEIGISVSANDAIILRTLTEMICWSARYPAPSDGEKLFQSTAIFDKKRRSGEGKFEQTGGNI